MEAASVIPFSVLDLAPIVQGRSPAEAFRNALDLVRHAERWGYHTYWLAEHHNMPHSFEIVAGVRDTLADRRRHPAAPATFPSSADRVR